MSVKDELIKMSGYNIPEGEVAIFELDRELLEQLLDLLPPEHTTIHFKMDSDGKVTVLGPIDDDQD